MISTRFTRRSFIGIASAAALSVATSNRRTLAQSDWTLAADVIGVGDGFGLLVTFAIEFFDPLPLFLQVADAEGPAVFFNWEQLTESTGADLLEIGPYAIPYGRSYIVTIVTALGEPSPLSPVVEIDIPSLPEASF